MSTSGRPHAEQAYLSSTKEALLQVRAAIAEAAALLPEHVVQQHWIRQKISPSPWADVSAWWRAHADVECGNETAAVLDHIVWLAEAREKLQGLLIQAAAAGRPPDLSLPRVRRRQ